MNRDRMTRGRTMMSGATTLGMPERLERTLIYPLILALVLLPIGLGWLIAVALGLLVYFVDKNRSLRWNPFQPLPALRPLPILRSPLSPLQLILAVLPLAARVIGLPLSLLSAAT